jgi:hypothetical protein
MGKQLAKSTPPEENIPALKNLLLQLKSIMGDEHEVKIEHRKKLEAADKSRKKDVPVEAQL